MLEWPVPYFLGKKRAFEIQVQGQFKRPPKGVVWFGAEVTRPPGPPRFLKTHPWWRLRFGSIRLILRSVSKLFYIILHGFYS